MSTTNVDSSRKEEPNVGMSIWNIENEKEKPEVTTGNHAKVVAVIEELEGKNVFPLNVIMKDDGTVVVRLKQNGEIKTIPLSDYASEQVKQNRRIKSNPVPAKKVTPKTKGEDR